MTTAASGSSADTPSSATQLLDTLERISGAPLPLRLQLWDGSTAGDVGPLLRLTRPQALRRLLLRPDDLGLARAYISGDLDVEGSLVDLLRTAIEFVERSVTDLVRLRVARTLRRVAALAAAIRWLARAGVVGPPLPRPAAELPRRRLRGAEGIRYHYDLSNAFYRLMLGPSMVYSCAVWPDPSKPDDLAQAQLAKLDKVCRKLELRQGMRLLDIGCGYGGLAIHAAQHFGVDVVAVTLSPEQAAYGRAAAAAAGLSDRIDFRVADFRDVRDGPYDAVSSIEVGFHLGSRGLREHARSLHDLVRPGGPVFVHDITASRRGRLFQATSSFMTSYIFPEIDVATLRATIGHLEAAGLEIQSVENLREDFAASNRVWLANIEDNWEAVVQEIGLQRARAWRWFMATGAVTCDTGLMTVTHLSARRPAQRA